MGARILDGAALARGVGAELAARIVALAARGVRPGVAVLQVGENPASNIYVKRKVRACGEVGVYSEVHRLTGDCSEGAAIGMLDRLNADPRIHGIIVQLPLPPHLDAARILQAIVPEKDVDGFGWHSLGALVDGHPQFVPCTPLGIMRLIAHAAVPLEGARAVVVGRSAIVGKPMALLLIARSATVTVCHSRTRDLASYARSADILVVATGKPRMITGDMIKDGAVVIDVGINRLSDGKLCGDVDFEAASRVASWITPVPGGVGPMTVAMLLSNTVDAAERIAGGDAGSRARI